MEYGLDHLNNGLKFLCIEIKLKLSCLIFQQHFNDVTVRLCPINKIHSGRRRMAAASLWRAVDNLGRGLQKL